MQPVNQALRKRAQIALANRAMFMWVAGVSVIFGFAIVGVIFLAQMLVFNEKVLIEKNRTVSNLNSNLKVVNTLETNVKKLDANQALISSRSKSDDQAIQAVLDALPSDANSLALGASLQNKLLANISGLELQSLQVDQVIGTESLNSGGLVISGSTDMTNEISFNFSVSGDDAALKQALVNLEKSIRTINVISVSIESQGAVRTMNVKAKAYYEPAIKVELKEKVVK